MRTSPHVPSCRRSLGSRRREIHNKTPLISSVPLYEREGSKKKEYDSVADEWVHQRVTESESDDDSVEALTVRTPLQ